MPDAVLALDQGTTGSTAIIFADDGRVLGRGYSEFAQSYPQPGWVEHDPEEIWRVSRQVMDLALAGARVAPRTVKALGITNQRETTIVWDRVTGVPVHPAIVWQSRQTSDICEALRRNGLEPLFRERTGLVLDAYFSGTKIKWILDRYPEVRAQAANGRIAFGTVDSWLLWKLTGGRVHATDPTNASRTLLYNIHERRWDPALLEALDIPAAILPEVKPSRGLFGEVRGAAGFPDGVPIAGIAGDQQAALYGQACWDAGMAKNTYGTGSFLVLNLGQRDVISRHGLLTTICCDRNGAPAYALEGAIFIAGAAIQWLRDAMGIIRTAAETDELAASVPDTLGVYFVPALAGLGAPYWDMNARGTITGLTRGAGRAHLVRATLESLAYQTRDVVDAMNADAGLRLTELRVDGGAAANDFLMQFQADVLDVPVDRPVILDTTAAGAAFLAGLGAGVWRNPDEVQAVCRHERRFSPRMAVGDRDRLYAGWQRAVRQARAE